MYMGDSKSQKSNSQKTSKEGRRTLIAKEVKQMPTPTSAPPKTPQPTKKQSSS